MQKDFDGWNEQKKRINDRLQAPEYNERQIRWCSLGTNVGSEQDGVGKSRSRPVLILKGLSRKLCLVIPLTASLSDNPYHLPIGFVDGKLAAAIISQLRLIDSRRLDVLIGVLGKERFEEIRKAVKAML